MFQLLYTCQLNDDDKRYVAIRPELTVSSFGETIAEALASWMEAVTLFPEECQCMGP